MGSLRLRRGPSGVPPRQGDRARARGARPAPRPRPGSRRMCERLLGQPRDRELPDQPGRVSRRLMRARSSPSPARTAIATSPWRWRHVLGRPVQRIWHQETELPALDLIGMPGGFSYGDYLRCGAMAARSPVMREVVRRAERGVAVLGHLQRLPDPGRGRAAAGGADPQRRLCASSADRSSSRSPRATAPSPPYARSAGAAPAGGAPRRQLRRSTRDGLERLRDEDRIAFRYRDNPNGSTADIAGVLGGRGNVLGLMPHPSGRSSRCSAAATASRCSRRCSRRRSMTRLEITAGGRRRARAQARRVRAHPGASSAARPIWSSSASSR